MPDDQRDPVGSKEGDVLMFSHNRADQGDSRGETADHWHVAEWDDVFWWVSGRLEQIDLNLWRVAP
jgi:hypothetical protein